MDEGKFQIHLRESCSGRKQDSNLTITKVGRAQLLDYRAEVLTFAPLCRTNTQSLKRTEK